MTARTVKPASNPVTIDWSNPQTQGLVGLWDLQQAHPVDLTGVWGDLSNGIPGDFVETPNGIGQRFSQQPNGGLWTPTASVSPLDTTMDASFMAIMVMPNELAWTAVLIEAAAPGTGPSDQRSFAGIAIQEGGQYGGEDETYPGPPPGFASLHYTINNNEAYIPTSNTGTLARNLEANTCYHIIGTIHVNPTGIGNLKLYVNGTYQGSSVISFQTGMSTLKTMGLGCRRCLGQKTTWTGDFTHDSNLITNLDRFTPADSWNMYVNGPSGVPTGTYTIPDWMPSLDYFIMSQPFSGANTRASFHLTGSKGVGNLPVSMGAVWKRELTLAEVIENYNDSCGFVIYQSDLDEIGSRAITDWTEQNELLRPSRIG